MFHAVPAHLQPHIHPTHAASQQHMQMQMQMQMQSVNPTVSDAAMFHGFPATTPDGRQMVYYMPSTATAGMNASLNANNLNAAAAALFAPTASQNASSITTPPQSWLMGNASPMLSAAVTASGRVDHLTPTMAAPNAFPMMSNNNNNNSNSVSAAGQSQTTPPHASDLRRSPPALASGPPPYAGTAAEKAAADASMSAASSSLPVVSLLRPTSTGASAVPKTATAAISQSVNGMSATNPAFDASTTSNVSGLPSHQDSSAVACPFLASTTTPTTPQQPQQPQTCYWLDSTTGTMKAMTPEEVAAAMAANTRNATATVPTFAAVPAPHPSTHGLMAPGDSMTSAAYAVLPPASFNASTASMFSASLSGAVPYIPIVAMAPPPPPPPAPKTMNGLQYVHGELYEGFVKRYNPNRGFGFLTATYHIKPDHLGCGSAAGSPAASLTAMPNTSTTSNTTNNNMNLSTASPTTAAAPAPKERRIPVHLGDIFVHQSYMHMQGFRTLPVGGRVRFRVGFKDGQQTFQAVDVELLPQVVPQSMEASATTAMNASATAAPAGSPASAQLPYNAASLPSDKTSSSANSISNGSPAAGGAATSAHGLASPHSAGASISAQHPLMSAAEFEKAIGSIGSPVGGHDGQTESERFYFGAAAKEARLGRSPVTLTQGESVDDEDEDDSPLIELAFEVYNSLEE